MHATLTLDLKTSALPDKTVQYPAEIIITTLTYHFTPLFTIFNPNPNPNILVLSDYPSLKNSKPAHRSQDFETVGNKIS